MKAWVVSDMDDEEGVATVVFAENRGKAKSAALSTDACAWADGFTRISCRRFPEADKQYRGRFEMDWNNEKDRLFLVKHGWSCVEGEESDCADCPARQSCEKWEAIK